MYETIVSIIQYNIEVIFAQINVRIYEVILSMLEQKMYVCRKIIICIFVAS